MSELAKIQEKLKKFSHERDWEQFHHPKNLVMALSVEASELLEHFQWLEQSQSVQSLSVAKQEAIRDEVADVMLYLLRFCSVANIDLINACEQKMLKNEAKYPVEKSRGVAKGGH